MEIRISISDVINNVRAVVSLETKGVKDSGVQNMIEIASKTPVLTRNVSGASSSMLLNLHRFLTPVAQDMATDDMVDEDALVYQLSGGSRRFDGKEKAIALKVHECLVELSLERFFDAVGIADLSKMHASQSALVLNELESALRRKGVPKLSEP